MSYRIDMSKEAHDTIARFQKSNIKAFHKVMALIKDITEHPRTGIGHPEPLKKGDDRTYSRRISKKDRLIYDIHDEIITVLIISAEGHYSDK